MTESSTVYPKATMDKFDQLLDRLNLKNAKIGSLVSELAETRELLDKLTNTNLEPLAKRSLRSRIAVIDRTLKEAIG